MSLNLEEKLLGNFTEYADYVNNERAIVHYYDGLKPVLRRSLFTMYNMGLTPDKQTKKCATIVGKVLEFHPHGDSGVYNAIARAAQPFSLLVPVITGMGNFGSLEMGPAAMRYTEAKISPLGYSLVEGLKDKIVPMVPNYDGTTEEPSFLPVPFPYLLVNGTSGIGVGMAASMPSHNLSDVIDMVSYAILNPEASTSELVDRLKGPDFSSACDIVNKNDFKEIYSKGSGSFKMRAKFSVTGSKITATNLPYKVGGAKILEQLNSAMERGECSFIKEVFDLSGVNQEVLIDISTKDTEKAIQELCRVSDLEKSFSLDFSVVLDSPRRLNLRDYLDAWIRTHKELNRQRLEQERAKAIARLHILEGLLKATKMMDQVIKTIRQSEDRAEAKQGLVALGFTLPQVEAILEMRLARLTKLNELTLQKEAGELRQEVENLTTLLENEVEFNNYLVSEMAKYKKLAAPRKSALIQKTFVKVNKEVDSKFNLTLVRNKKKALISEGYSSKAVNGDAKSPVYVLHGDSVTPVKNAKETVIADVWEVLDDKALYTLHFSEDGYVKKTKASDLKTSRKAIVAKQTKVVSVLLTDKEEDKDLYVLLTLNNGKQVQFNIDDINPTGRNTRGVIAVKLAEGESVADAVWTKKVPNVQVGRNKKIK